jgi:protein-tyrosine phosphatase
MKHYLGKKQMEMLFEVDSCGTIPYHTGEKPDPRMIFSAGKRGYKLTHRARMFNPENDFKNFDYIVVMDNNNYNDITAYDPAKKYGDKIYKMVQFCENYKVEEVPDPYYLGPSGFETVLDILEDACTGLLNRISLEMKGTK